MAQPNEKPPRKSGNEFDRSPSGPKFTLFPFALSLLVASGIVVVIFGAYEIMERTWFADLDHETRNLLHRIRGILAALVAGITVGWVIVRSSPALLTATAVDEALTPEHVSADRFRIYAQWFIAMRWIAVLVAGLLVFLGVPVFELLPEETWWPLVATVALLAACNFFYTARVHRSAEMRRLLVWQNYLDLLLFAALLHFTGGAENPLAVFMLFQVVIGGVLLSQAECYRIAATGSLLFALMALGQWSGLLPHYPLQLFPGDGAIPAARHPPFVLTAIAVQTTILFVTAYFITTLSERLRRNERRLTSLAERALADRRLLEQALESTGTGMRVLNPELKPVWVNDRWKDWFGDKTETCQLFPEYPGVGCPARNCLEKGELDVFEIERPPAAGNLQNFQITSAPIHNAGGDINRIVQLAQDTTAQKEAHTRMMRAGQMAAVGELAGQVAHEVNNPIAIISAKASLLLKNRRGEMSDKIADELGKIVDHTNRVARIAQGLLSYSRPSPTARYRIDLRQPIRKSISMIEHRARNREIKIHDNLPDTAVMATANNAEMEQVFLNLFINAIQAMAQGGRLTVTLLPDSNGAPGTSPPKTASAPGMLAIAVDDTGDGIPAEIRERVFEPFFTTKQESHGTGLGLSICQGLLRSHQGDIVIDAAPGGGARFIVRLPAG